MLSASGRKVNSFAGVQTPGVLDDLFLYSGPLGVQVDANGVEVALWAPTAHQVIELTLRQQAFSHKAQKPQY